MFLYKKLCQNHWFVSFHKFLIFSIIFKPKNNIEKHTMAIIIRNRSKLSLIYKDSYKSNKLDLSILGILFIPFLDKGSIIVFNTNIVQKDVVVIGTN